MSTHRNLFVNLERPGVIEVDVLPRHHLFIEKGPQTYKCLFYVHFIDRHKNRVTHVCFTIYLDLNLEPVTTAFHLVPLVLVYIDAMLSSFEEVKRWSRLFNVYIPHQKQNPP